MKNNLKAEIRADNWIFKCGLEDKFYNARDVSAYFITIIKGLAPTQSGQVAMVPEPFVICEKCYKDNLDNKDKLNFSDPSGLILPNNEAIRKVGFKKT